MSLVVPKKYFMMTTRRCNCDCDYCYASPDNRDMSEEVLTTSTRQIMKTVAKPLFMWYGGEPILRARGFFEKAIELQEGKARNLIQTNLTLNKPELLEFLLENSFTISTSIDGPRRLHDLRRRYCSGNSNFSDIETNRALLQEKGYTPWAICVVSKTNVAHPEEIFDFFYEKGLNIRFCPTTTAEVNPVDYIKFMQRIHKKWQQKPEIKISNFSKARQTVITGTPQECDNMSNCLENNLCIDVDGQIYPCNRFAGNQEFSLGEVENGVLTALNSKKGRELAERTTNCEHNCTTCLNGGCMFNALSQHGDWKTVDDFCIANQELLNIVRQDE
ncbi:radical SAM protein [Candidatus Woesearchaeota archaeon]|jgi:uncharacterized protein|nr:radical SAM protein [Candidatus Woesearchaeota archaeon]MBT4368472.1 radical SAM protein [Candidatus Woesearchaeota archaeon]MBT4712961.1 radical SAM protein [Candidatus Woesearchaeota archaeon]MBT6639873.1 radical SAM protein [Candidatus Woesearchaeota archaeon]MBT7134045.1 radical SAM protein [Candidatus Woesearchaeota archaeon]